MLSSPSVCFKEKYDKKSNEPKYHDEGPYGSIELVVVAVGIKGALMLSVQQTRGVLYDVLVLRPVQDSCKVGGSRPGVK